MPEVATAALRLIQGDVTKLGEAKVGTGDAFQELDSRCLGALARLPQGVRDEVHL